MAAGQVVGYCKLGVLNIGYPVIGVHVIDAKQVEGIHTHPDILDLLEFTACLYLIKICIEFITKCLSLVGLGKSKAKIKFCSTWNLFL